MQAKAALHLPVFQTPLGHLCQLRRESRIKGSSSGLKERTALAKSPKICLIYRKYDVLQMQTYSRVRSVRVPCYSDWS